jgi:septum formation protein
LFAQVALAVVPRAGGEVDHQVEPPLGKVGERVEAVAAARGELRVRPDVLADRDADFFAVEREDGGRDGGGLEVAVFVEDVVGGQETFPRVADDSAVLAESGGVEEAAAGGGGIFFNGADQRGHAADKSGDFGEGGLDVGDEAALEEKVAGRVAADDELGENDQSGTLGDEGLVGVEDEPAVAGQVADGGVELGKSDAHERVRGATCGPVFALTTHKAHLPRFVAAHKHGDMFNPPRLMLASASPRRRELLAGLGVEFEVIAAQVTEHEESTTDPRVMVAHNAALKADWVAARHPCDWVLGADTTVFIDGHALNKPADGAGAREMLRRLSGRTHTVFTGIALRNVAQDVRIDEGVASEVTLRVLDETMIEAYLAKVHTLDKAGGYGIQDHGEMIVAGYSGSLTNIIGLPVDETKQLLIRCGLLKT